MYIIRHFIFKRKHSGYIEISGSGNQIFSVCIFTGELIPQKMAAIIKIFSIYIVIFYGMPSSRFNHSDHPTFFCRHQFRSDFGLRISTSTKGIQLTVKFISRRKIRNISINFYTRTAAVFRNISRRNSLLLFFCLFSFLVQCFTDCIRNRFGYFFREIFCIFFYICKKNSAKQFTLLFYIFQSVWQNPSITQSNCNTKYNCGYHIFFFFSFSCMWDIVSFSMCPPLFPLTDIICTVKSIITFRFSKNNHTFDFYFSFNCQCIIFVISYTSTVTSNQTQPRRK